MQATAYNQDDNDTEPDPETENAIGSDEEYVNV
jgi:hypothetical protein